MNLKMAMITGPDEWNHVESRHLDGDTERKTKAVRMKENLIRLQENRVIVRNGIHIGASMVQENYITRSGHLDLFCEEVLEQLDDEKRIVFLETWGDTDRWEKGRREIDGDNFCKNEESAGIVGICLRVRPMKRHERLGPDPFAYIHIGKILENERGNRPVIPDKLALIFTHPNALFVGENISRHLLRLENSFFTRLDRIKYMGLTDFVNCYERTKRDIWDRFYVEPFSSSGILANFHRVFPHETFFKNPYEAVADWDSCSTMRDSQLVYAFTNLWAMSAIFDEAIQHYEEHKMQLSPMFTNFPRIVVHERRDDGHLRMRRGACPPPPWYQEKVWPKGEMSRHPSCPYGSGNPAEIRQLQNVEREEEYGSLPEGKRRLKRQRLDGAIGNNDQVDEHRRDDDAEKREKEDMQARARAVVTSLHSEMPDRDLECALKLGDGDEVWLLVGLMEAISYKALLRRLLEFFGNRWPNDRKSRFIETLAAEGYFETRKDLGMVTMMRHTTIAALMSTNVSRL